MVKSYLNTAKYIIIIIPLITLIVSAIYTNTPILTGILTELSSSLNDFPLSELNLAENCSEDSYASVLYTIPKSNEGCSCTNVSNYPYKQTNKRLVFNGKCKKNHTLNKCITISSYPAVDLKKWYSNQFCSKKYINVSGYKYFFKNSVGKNENCTNGYKRCGKLDDLDNYICISENEVCSINDIFISKDKNLTGYESYQKYALNDNKYIYFTNNSDKPIITKLKTTEGKLCVGKGYYHTDYPQFILDDNFNLYGCRYKIMESIYDESIIELDSMTKTELYNYSNISMYSRYNNYSQYPYYSLNANIILYSKRYIGFNKSCLIENDYDIDNNIFKKEIIDKINNGLATNRKLQEVLIWISIAAIDIYFMACFFINIDESNNLINFYIWSGITLPFYLSMNIITIIGLAYMSNIKKYPLCNDYITNSKIEIYNTRSRNFFINTLFSFIIVNVQLILTVVLYLLKRKKILLNKNNINTTENNSSVNNSLNKLSQNIPLMYQSQKEDND